MKTLRALAALMILSSSASAVEAAMEPREAAERFFSTLRSSGPEIAFDQLFAGSSMAETQPSALALLKQQTLTALSLYGSPLGVEPVSEKALSESVVRVNYMLKFESLPLAWTLYFYKPTDVWIAIGAQFNDRIAFPNVE